MGKLNAVRCDADFQRALEELANARGWSVPALFREAARQYMQGEELHRAMVDLEKRQAGSFKALHKEVRRLRHDMRVLMAVQELFIMMLPPFSQPRPIRNKASGPPMVPVAPGRPAAA
ncbi:ribbon-helix-helix domain-containing protein [Paracidovorax citrulli]|uniref:ribbon-helix-helix domain-containing protein n=1 Tax=Paracidovorax citrulli TaxID=80869 RepID=UPI0009E46857|nr:ribbon-helix-helix domain-containing protein [Paracidovorax citrulli]